MEKNTELMTAAQVRACLGGVSDMTIWRWLEDEQMDFPRPIYIRRNRYWHESEIENWIEAQGADQ